MVIISGEEARRFLFSYEKLFGAKEKSATDLKNESEGTENNYRPHEAAFLCDL